MESTNLREMLAEAKDRSELMVDLAYASVFFNDVDMADEVESLEVEINDLVYRMRTLSIVAVRHPREAEAMSAVLQVISSVEAIGNHAVYIARVVSRRLGIPHQLIVDLMAAEEVSHRVEVAEGSEFANRPISEFELPVNTGLRIMAMRRDRRWIVDPDGDEILTPGDVMFLRGSPDGIGKLRELAGAHPWVSPPTDDAPALSDLDRAVDTVIEMKNLSEVAVGLAYSALTFGDRQLAAEVLQLEDRLDDMKERLELWVLRAAGEDIEPSQLRGMLHLAEAAEGLGNHAKQMVWLIERQGELHEVLEMALGDTDDVVVLMPVADGAQVSGVSLAQLALNTESGFGILAIERNGRYIYDPHSTVTLNSGDRVLANGPEEGRTRLAELFGWTMSENDEGQLELTALDETALL